MAEQMEAMRDIVAETTTSRASSEAQMADLARAVERMAQGGSGLDDTNDLLMRVAEGQEALIAQLKDGGADGLDAESRMRLRSIDVQLLRILEEMAAGRQETVSELRAELGALRRSLTIGRGRSGGGDL